MAPQEQDAVLLFIRSYLGSARCGMVDHRWSAEQQQYGNHFVTDLMDRIDWYLSSDTRVKIDSAGVPSPRKD